MKDFRCSSDSLPLPHDAPHHRVVSALAAWLGLGLLLLAASACHGSSSSPAYPPPLPSSGKFAVELEAVEVPGLPGLHSFVTGHHDGRWLVLGGRKDGLHKRRPFEAFLQQDSNANLYVLDPEVGQVWSQPLSALPVPVQEQFASTNLEFTQRGEVLYIMGGYGYSPTAGDHITHPLLTALDVPAVISAIVDGSSVAAHVRYLSDERMAVTGGYLGRLGERFYLAGGQRFTGRYNPMGPSHGPGFVQAYTDEIRRFGIVDDGQTLAITDYTAWHDGAVLHRRDYNMVRQVFPDGSPGFTMFSGVFQPTTDLPWLDSVDVRADGYTHNAAFTQRLSQYHSAHLALFDQARNEMHTVFFGGMARYFVADGALVDDPEVPFVKTISLVTRDGTGRMEEYVVGEMPALLGSGAEFLENPALTMHPAGVALLPDLSTGEGVFVGYILGGIESTLPHVFFSDAAQASFAAPRLYRVRLRAAAPGA